jgi:undecaprenyl-diphosphatase
MADRARTIDVGASALAVSSALAMRGLSRWEATVFRLANDTPDGLATVCWLPMQAGAGASPLLVAAGLSLGRGTRALAPGVATAGLGAWAAAKVAKRLVGRGRPGAHLQGVHVRPGGTGPGQGFVPGHAAAAAAVTARLAPCLPPGGLGALRALVALVGFARMQNGSHLPLDVVGGVGLGLLVAGIVPEWPRHAGAR